MVPGNRGEEAPNWEVWGRPPREEDSGSEYEMSRPFQAGWEEKAGVSMPGGGGRVCRSQVGN